MSRRPEPPLELIRDYISRHPNDRLTAGGVASAVFEENKDLLMLSADKLIIRGLTKTARDALRATGQLSEDAVEDLQLPFEFAGRRTPARISVPPVGREHDIKSQESSEIQWVPLWQATKAEVRRHYQLLLNNEEWVVQARIQMADLLRFLNLRGVGDDEVIGPALRRVNAAPAE